ncbi:dynein light chain Tctex-type 4-like [Ornithorhynchus anatinus]|uniref:dynein light chain Tctex-type 4-like n=1 Tax=Ornithorhynchus anatinus TaxID=9258 RepID=UPI0019D46F9B|nr:dynein light chain Tctex-type 4-like [Ornithorhynchus anatinus]
MRALPPNPSSKGGAPRAGGRSHEAASAVRKRLSPSAPLPGRAPGLPARPPGAPRFSLRGLLAAQRVTKELKNRAAQKTRSRLQPPPRSAPVTLVRELVSKARADPRVPAWAASPEERFPRGLVEELVRAHLRARLTGVTYRPAEGARLATALSDEIRARAKAVAPPRYKLVCHVSVGSGPGLAVTSRCLWDVHSDCFAAARFANASLFCVGLVFAIYIE